MTRAARVVDMNKVCVKPWSHDWLIAARAYPGLRIMKRLGIFLLPLDRMLVHHRSLPHNCLGFPNNSLIPIYTWVERGTVKVKCLIQEYNSVPGQGSNPYCSIRRRVH